LHAPCVIEFLELSPQKNYKGLPRVVEGTLALAGLIVTAPVILVSGLAVMLSSGAPILFRQQRVGRHGKEFSLYKLRTMKTSSGGPQITSGNDARITRLGSFFRHTKLDELPTLWNVVRGDMSLVGPRPEVPRFVKLEDPAWQKILTVRPGITDPVTLQLRSEADLLAAVAGDTEQFYVDKLQPEKLKGYLAYLEQRSWQGDLKVLFRTVAAVVAPHNAAQVSLDDVSRLPE
jgi:lipopolysaccharide/colanic/teichoic acid biosynthesis glycosyltransferase